MRNGTVLIDAGQSRSAATSVTHDSPSLIFILRGLQRRTRRKSITPPHEWQRSACFYAIREVDVEHRFRSVPVMMILRGFKLRLEPTRQTDGRV